MRALLVLALLSTAALAEEPKFKISAPGGFEVSVWARAPNARAMTWGDKGTLFVGSKEKGNVYAIRDLNGDGFPDVKIIAKDLKEPTGVAFKDKALYVAAIDTLYRYDDIENQLEKTLEPVKVTKFPSETWHGWREIGFGPDGKLYVAIGAPCNVCEPKEGYATILKMNADGTERTTVAKGVRNSVGITWHPTTKRLWFTENGRDMLGDDKPEDELNVVMAEGSHFGFPACHQGDVVDPEFGKGRKCSEFVAPVAKLGPHTAALGLAFYTGKSFPKDYQGDLFIALHGSWNRSKKSGYQVVRAKVDGDKVTKVEPFLTGFLDGEKTLGRPVDVIVASDGALLVSDDENGVIYRVAPAAPAKK
ncbi:MAG: PQQ-dependent sugar dehydrogenase [Archangium sp.]